MYFHQPIVYFFFGNNASVIVLTKALGFSMCLGIFLQLSNWVRSGHRAMFVQCSYNVRTMFVQCSYNGKKKFVQCSYNAPLNFVQYCTNFFLPLYEIVRTLCVPSCTSTFDGISKNTSRQAHTSYRDSAISPVLHLILTLSLLYWHSFGQTWRVCCTQFQVHHPIDQSTKRCK